MAAAKWLCEVGIASHIPSLVQCFFLICSPERFDEPIRIVADVLLDVVGIKLNIDKCAMYLRQ